MATMKRFSRVAHESMSELNITSLLDLCFVLLVIFIITTAPVTNDLDMALPKAAKREKEPKPKVQCVTIDKAGQVFLNRMPVDSQKLLDTLIEMRRTDADLNVTVRGDKKTKHKYVMGILEVLQQANIGKVDLATDPKPN